MRRIIIFAVVALALATTKAAATCQEVWEPPIADRPEISCAKFTVGLLLSLRGATREQVVEAMNATGLPWKEKSNLMLHFVSPQEQLGGDMNFVFGDGSRVTRIFGVIDKQDFVWP